MLSLYFVTFNCGREVTKAELLAGSLLSALPDTTTLPEIVVIALEEVAPLETAFWGGNSLSPYTAPFKTALQLASTKRLHGASASSARAKDDVYDLLITRNVGMTAILVFVAKDVRHSVKWVEEAGVGVGWYEMGNKGAVGIRLGIDIHELEAVADRDSGEMQLTFVSAHLFPGESGVAKRNLDWENIVRALYFTKVPALSGSRRAARHSARSIREDGDGEDDLLLVQPETDYAGLYSPNSYVFVLGDLNYRISSTSPKDSDVPNFPQPGSRSLPNHYSHFLKRDQLAKEIGAKRTLHGFVEAPIDFPPTYKYIESSADTEVSSARSRSRQAEKCEWASHRWPSWCDRILWIPTRSRKPLKGPAIHHHNYESLPLMPTSDHQPVVLSVEVETQEFGPDNLDDDDVRLNPPYAVDPTLTKWRTWARTKELGLATGMYLSWTWEGNAVILLAAVGGIFGPWAVGSLMRLMA